MTPEQRTRQQQACHIQFKTLRSEGIVPETVTVYDYVFQTLGVKVDSLKLLSDPQLNALRSRLMGKPDHMTQKLDETVRALGIDDFTGWMRHKAESPGYAWLSGYTPETLPAGLQHRLLQSLAAWQRTKQERSQARRRDARLQPQLF